MNTFFEQFHLIIIFKHNITMLKDIKNKFYSEKSVVLSNNLNIFLLNYYNH